MITRLTLVCLFIISLVSPAGYAATVLNVELDDMLNNSEFVFEGRAINIETIRGANINLTKTEVEFEILDIIKGSYPDKTIKIRFAGGTVDGVTLHISGMHYPELGEKGVYFIETLSRDLVHPFYGWSQGHFLITKQNTVTTRGSVPVVDIVETETTQSTEPLTDGDGIARGVIVRKSSNTAGGMSSGQFKDKLKSMLDDRP
jgi:hypothetical protein